MNLQSPEPNSVFGAKTSIGRVALFIFRVLVNSIIGGAASFSSVSVIANALRLRRVQL
jgi:cation transport ATPase